MHATSSFEITGWKDTPWDEIPGGHTLGRAAVDKKAAVADSNGQRGDWTVVPGSGTGNLQGLTGRGEYRHDKTEATFTLDYEIA